MIYSADDDESDFVMYHKYYTTVRVYIIIY